MRRLRPIAFVLLFAALAGYEAYAIFFQELATVEYLPAAKDSYLTREIRGNDFLLHSFIVLADGFHAFEVFPRKSEQPPVGPIRFRVFDGEQLLAIKMVDTATLDLTGPLRVPVPYVDHSAGRVFIIEIMLHYAPPGHGLRFEAGSPAYLHGNLQISGKAEWGDLKFRAIAERTTIFSNLRKLRQTWPGPLRSDAFLILALIVGNAALAIVVYGLAFAPDAGEIGARGVPGGRQLPNGSDGITADQPRV
jgi:hypothetical protein